MKWCQRNSLSAKIYVTLMGMVKENYALCLHTQKNLEHSRNLE